MSIRAGPPDCGWIGPQWNSLSAILVNQPELSRLGIYERYAERRSGRVEVAPNQNIENNPMQSKKGSPARKTF
jgi:hypothetical protein